MMTYLYSIKIETPRLYLMPLNYSQLLKYSNYDDSLETELGTRPSPRELSSELMETIKAHIIPYMLDHPDLALYATLWIINMKCDDIIVGDIAFKGAPSNKGLVEIGYGTYPQYRNKGIMTEAVGALTAWAFNQPGIEIILAETDKMNLSSQKILKKNNFQPFAETEEMYWWRLDKETLDN